VAYVISLAIFQAFVKPGDRIRAVARDGAVEFEKK